MSKLNDCILASKLQGFHNPYETSTRKNLRKTLTNSLSDNYGKH